MGHSLGASGSMTGWLRLADSLARALPYREARQYSYIKNNKKLQGEHYEWLEHGLAH